MRKANRPWAAYAQPTAVVGRVNEMGQRSRAAYVQPKTVAGR